MDGEIKLMGWAFVLSPIDHLKIMAGEITKADAKWDELKEFIGVRTIGVMISYHIFLTREAMHAGAEMARKAGFDPFEMTVQVPVDEEMMRGRIKRDG